MKHGRNAEELTTKDTKHTKVRRQSFGSAVQSFDAPSPHPSFRVFRAFRGSGLPVGALPRLLSTSEARYLARFLPSMEISSSCSSVFRPCLIRGFSSNRRDARTGNAVGPSVKRKSAFPQPRNRNSRLPVSSSSRAVRAGALLTPRGRMSKFKCRRNDEIRNPNFQLPASTSPLAHFFGLQAACVLLG